MQGAPQRSQWAVVRAPGAVARKGRCGVIVILHGGATGRSQWLRHYHPSRGLVERRRACPSARLHGAAHATPIPPAGPHAVPHGIRRAESARAAGARGRKPVAAGRLHSRGLPVVPVRVLAVDIQPTPRGWCESRTAHPHIRCSVIERNGFTVIELTIAMPSYRRSVLSRPGTAVTL